MNDQTQECTDGRHGDCDGVLPKMIAGLVMACLCECHLVCVEAGMVVDMEVE